MNQLEKEQKMEIEKAHAELSKQEGGFVLDYDLAAKAAATISLKWIEDFRDWYDNPPAGSGCGIGLYNMSTTDLVEKFISHKSKVSNTKENP